MKAYTSNPRGIKPLVRGEIIPAQGASINFADEDVDGNSVSIITGTSDPGEFSVGAAVMGQLTFTLLNGSGAFSNIEWYDSQVNFHLLVGNDDFDMGTFYVVDHKETGYNVTVTCYDALKVLDEYQLYEDKQDATTPLTFPTSVASAISNVAGHRGLTVTGLPSIANNITINDPNDDYMSERSFISYCAQLCGVFVTAYKSQLRFGWYDTSNTPYDMGVTFSHDLRTNDITITGVKVVTADGSTTDTRGTTGYQLEIEDNPLIDADNIARVAGYIYAAVHGITYRPGTVDIVGTPALEAGDRIEVETAQESGIILLATTINYGTDLTISVTAECEPYAGDLRINRSRYIKKVAKQAVAEELADANSELSQAIDQAAGGSEGALEIVTVRGATMYCKPRVNGVITFDTRVGWTMEWPFGTDAVQRWSSEGALWQNRNPENPNQDQDGIDIVSVHFPTQQIIVPKNHGGICWTELMIDEIVAPSLAQYQAKFGSSFTQARMNARVVRWAVDYWNPWKVKIMVKRYKGEADYKYDLIRFADGQEFDNVSRPPVWLDGLDKPQKAYGAYPNPGVQRVGRCKVPILGQCFDLRTFEGGQQPYTQQKWCRITGAIGYINGLEAIDASVIEYDT